MSGWQLRAVPLKFGLGDWTAFSVPLRLHVRSVGLSEQQVPYPVSRPFEHVPLGPAAGYMLRAMPVSETLPTLSMVDGFIRYVTLQYRHCLVDLSIGFDAYREKFSAKTRATINRKIKKFKEHCGGELRWRCYCTVDTMREFHRLARAVSEKTYQERLLNAGIPDDADFIEAMLHLAARDEVRAYILFDGERPVSYLYCPVQDGTLIYAYLGYDPDYKKLSVGTVLQWLALEALFAERRFAYFDFTEGQSDHKLLFATNNDLRANVMFVKRTLPRLALLCAHAMLDALSKAAGQVARRWGVHARLRRMLKFGVGGAK